jgi:hypothetical protein
VKKIPADEVNPVKFEDFKNKVKLKLLLDSNRYVIAKVREVPAFSEKVFAVIRNRNGITVIAKEGAGLSALSEERFFRMITFDVELPFDLSGFISHISGLLASKAIPIFVISSYSTDHIFVKEKYLNRTLGILKEDLT